MNNAIHYEPNTAPGKSLLPACDRYVPFESENWCDYCGIHGHVRRSCQKKAEDGVLPPGKKICRNFLCFAPRKHRNRGCPACGLKCKRCQKRGHLPFFHTFMDDEILAEAYNDFKDNSHFGIKIYAGERWGNYPTSEIMSKLKLINISDSGPEGKVTRYIHVDNMTAFRREGFYTEDQKRRVYELYINGEVAQPRAEALQQEQMFELDRRHRSHSGDRPKEPKQKKRRSN